MKRESAVSETISYDTGHCSICDTEVALDQSAPDGVIEPKGYAAILGEGELNKDVEHQGNWDFELAFQLDETDQRHPNVSGFIICEQCASTIHGHPDEAEHYHGKIPNEIASGSLVNGVALSDETAIFDEMGLEMRQGAVALAVILLAVMLILVFSL